MAKENYQEPEERINPTEPIDTTIPTEEFDPLEGEKKTRMHTTSGVGAGSSQPMPEYTVTPDLGAEPTDNGNGANQQQQSWGNGGEQEQEIPEYDQIKDQDKNMTPKETMENAEMTADMGLDALGEGLKWIGNQIMPIKQRTQKKIYREGVDPEMPLQYGQTQITTQQAFNIHNESCHRVAETFPLPEKTKAKIRPIIARELAKRGMVMSPILYVGIVLGQHFVKCGKLIVDEVKKKGDLIDAIKETGKYYKNYTAAHMSIPKQPEPTPTVEPVQEEHVILPPEERTANKFNQIQNNNRRHRKAGVKSVRKPSKKRKPTTAE